MTPTAVTPAARTRPAGSGAKRPSSPHPSSPRSTHRAAPSRRSPAPRAPRRISGPARPAAAPPQTPRAPQPAQRRISRPLGERAVAFLRGLPDHALLDRVVRGRLWIPLLGLLLVGIVAMQVEVLKLNASIGRATIVTSRLQTENQRLRATDSALAGDQRIESAAAQMGMTMPAPSTPQFISQPGAADLGRALENIHPPDPAGFAARTAAAASARAAQVIPSSGR